MLRTNNLLPLSLSALLLTGMAAAANAQTQITASSSVTSTTDFSGSFFFAKFNPGLGTLNSVFLTLGTNFTTSLLVTNSSATAAASGNAGTKLQSLLFDPSTTFTSSGGLLSSNNDGRFSLYDAVLSDKVGYTLAPSGSTTLHPPDAFNSRNSAPGFTNASTLSFFAGASGTAQINYLTLTTTVITNSVGNSAASQNTTDTFSATVQYNYTPVVVTSTTPEPGVWAMLFAGTASGLAALCRHRSKK